MVILKSQFEARTLVVLNKYFYSIFAPDMQIGHRMDPMKKSQSFKFISGFLHMTRDNPEPDVDAFEALLFECFPELDSYIKDCPLGRFYSAPSRFPLDTFESVFEIVLKSDFLTIFKTIGLDAKSGNTSLRNEELVSRSGEPMPTGTVLGVPASEYFDGLLYTFINAGNSDLMVRSVGSVGFDYTLERNDTDSTCTGPFPVIGTPEEIIQMRRLVYFVPQEHSFLL